MLDFLMIVILIFFDKDSNDLTIVSPGIPPHNKLVLNSKNISSDYDLFYDEMPFLFGYQN